jgi:ATP-dependent Clp protease ATP-binding subunit ClpB
MNYDKYTLKAQEAVQAAHSYAQKNDHNQIELEHILKALLESEGSIIRPLLERIGITIGALEDDIAKALSKLPKVFGAAAQLYFSSAASKVLAKAEDEALGLNDDYVASEHILLSILNADTPAGAILKKHGVNRTGILEALKTIRGNVSVKDQGA